MIVGFTGARIGMSEKQHQAVSMFFSFADDLLPEPIEKVIHGGCIGADIDFHHLAKGYHRVVMPGHFRNRPYDLSCRGDYGTAEEVLESKPMFERNRAIVNASDILIGTPSHTKTTVGGTWYTINYAIQREVNCIVYLPDGSRWRPTS